MPAVEIKNLLYGSDGEADPGLCAKRDNLPDVCVLPYIHEAQAVGLRKLIFEYLALTPGKVIISRSEFFR